MAPTQQPAGGHTPLDPKRRVVVFGSRNNHRVACVYGKRGCSRQNAGGRIRPSDLAKASDLCSLSHKRTADWGGAEAVG
ncbi:hypothetical protein CATMIT_02004 [Catenibacterium mitsuokai DSM 15897]|nr:hypothetical protein CATMIT_02004 [Catenibacterium mitsuokai DSM 15897]